MRPTQFLSLESLGLIHILTAVNIENPNSILPPKNLLHKKTKKIIPAVLTTISMC
jgi:hypothetical protein